jgi:hypothetical protein
MRTLAFALLLLASPVLARPWNGIDPGLSSREDVVKKFGEPSKAVIKDGKELLGYLQKQVIKGTSQVQFRVDVTSQKVERVDVFPEAPIDQATIENTYGPVCPPGPESATPCYVKKVTAAPQTYLHYAPQGLSVFLNDDLKTVHSFVFQAPKKKPAPAKKKQR